MVVSTVSQGWEVVTPGQLFYLLLVAVFPTEILLLPPWLIAHDGKDALWCVAFGTVPAVLLAVPVAGALARLNGMTLESYLLARWGTLGRVALLAFTAVLLVPAPDILAAYVHTTATSLLPYTPIYTLALVSFITAAYIVAGGIEVVARVSSIIVPVGVCLILLLVVIGLPWYDMANVRPLLPTAGIPIVDGSYRVFAFLAQVGFALAVRTTAPGQVQGLLIWSVIVNSGLLFLMLAMPLLLFGAPTAALLSSPVLSAIRTIHYGFAIERLDIVIAPVWVAFSLLKVALWIVLGTRLALAAVGIAGWQRTAARFMVFAAGLTSLAFSDMPTIEKVLDVQWFDVLAPVLVGLIGVLMLALVWRPARAVA